MMQQQSEEEQLLLLQHPLDFHFVPHTIHELSSVQLLILYIRTDVDALTKSRAYALVSARSTNAKSNQVKGLDRILLNSLTFRLNDLSQLSPAELLLVPFNLDSTSAIVASSAALFFSQARASQEPLHLTFDESGFLILRVSRMGERISMENLRQVNISPDSVPPKLQLTTIQSTRPTTLTIGMDLTAVTLRTLKSYLKRWCKESEHFRSIFTLRREDVVPSSVGSMGSSMRAVSMDDKIKRDPSPPRSSSNRSGSALRDTRTDSDYRDGKGHEVDRHNRSISSLQSHSPSRERSRSDSGHGSTHHHRRSRSGSRSRSPALNRNRSNSISLLNNEPPPATQPPLPETISAYPPLVPRSAMWKYVTEAPAHAVSNFEFDPRYYARLRTFALAVEPDYPCLLPKFSEEEMAILSRQRCILAFPILDERMLGQTNTYKSEQRVAIQTLYHQGGGARFQFITVEQIRWLVSKAGPSCFRGLIDAMTKVIQCRDVFRRDGKYWVELSRRLSKNTDAFGRTKTQPVSEEVLTIVSNLSRGGEGQYFLDRSGEITRTTLFTRTQLGSQIWETYDRGLRVAVGAEDDAFRLYGVS